MTKKRLAIIGGGITGLSAAYYAQKAARALGAELSVTLIEKTDRMGGTIQTEKKDGFLMERGPDSFITEKPWALELARELGLERKLISTETAFRGSMVYSGGRLIPVPEGFYLIAPSRPAAFFRTGLLSMRAKLRVVSEVFIPPRSEEGDESVGSFIRRRFGKDLYERLAQPMIGGIYSADPDKLSLECCLPRFREMEKKHRSVIRALLAKKNVKSAAGPRYGLFASFDGGLQTFVECLQAELSGVSVLNSKTVTKVSKRGTWKIIMEGGLAAEADAVLFAVPSWSAAAMLKEQAPMLSRDLSSIEYKSAATVNIAYAGAFPERYRCFGYVVPAIEKRPILGCSFSSLKYKGRAGDGHFLLRAFIGGASHKELLAAGDAELVRTVEDEIAKTLALVQRPLFHFVSRYSSALPQYQVGHKKLVRRIFLRASECGGLFLAGNAYEGVGIPDCVKSGKERAEDAVRFLFTGGGSGGDKVTFEPAVQRSLHAL